MKSQLKNKIKQIICEHVASSNMENKLKSLIPDFIKTAQTVYNDWEQSEDGESEEYGTGGICDVIADEMCNVVYEKTDYNCFSNYNEIDCHSSIYVYDSDNKLLFNVDIPPYVYETGTGYNWKKLKNIQFQKEDVILHDMTELYSEYIDDEGNVKDF